MTARGLRLVRGWIGAVVATFIAAGSHILAGGDAPELPLLLLALALSGLACTALTGRGLSLWRLSAGVALSQGLFHWLFSGAAAPHGTIGPAGGHLAHSPALEPAGRILCLRGGPHLATDVAGPRRCRPPDRGHPAPRRGRRRPAGPGDAPARHGLPPALPALAGATGPRRAARQPARQAAAQPRRAPAGDAPPRASPASARVLGARRLSPISPATLPSQRRGGKQP